MLVQHRLSSARFPNHLLPLPFCGHTEFDEKLWGRLVDNMTVYTKIKVKFTIRGGIAISVGEAENGVKSRYIDSLEAFFTVEKFNN